MRHLNYKHLYYFWTVAREGSIRRASELLHLTPQTISGQLTLLEQEAGAPLFTKAGRNLALTDVGQLVYGYAEEIFSLGAELEEILRNQEGGRPLQFAVGVADVVPKLIAYRLLEPALRLPDPVRIVGHENKLDNLLADIAVHKLDMVLADSPIRSNLNVRAFNHLLGECGVTFFAVPELAASLQENFPYSLDQTPVLLPTPSAVIRGSLMQWFDQLNIQPRIVGEFDDGALLMAFGQAGIGVFSAPSVIEAEIIKQYQVAPIGQTDQVRQQFYAISAERRLKHPAVVAISTAARSNLFASDAV